MGQSLCSMAPYDLANGGSVNGFFMLGMVWLWGVDVVLGNGCGIEGQNYFVFLEGSEMYAGFRYWDLILVI